MRLLSPLHAHAATRSAAAHLPSTPPWRPGPLAPGPARSTARRCLQQRSARGPGPRTTLDGQMHTKQGLNGAIQCVGHANGWETSSRRPSCMLISDDVPALALPGRILVLAGVCHKRSSCAWRATHLLCTCAERLLRGNGAQCPSAGVSAMCPAGQVPLTRGIGTPETLGPGRRRRRPA